MHRNNRSTFYCHQCGSSDLSTPHERPRRNGLVLLIFAVLGIAVGIEVLAGTLNALFSESPHLFGNALLITVCAAFVTVGWSWWKNLG